MASQKRLCGDENSDSTERSKKRRKDDEQTEMSLSRFGVGRATGPSDEVITASFTLLLFEIQNFTESTFIGSPYRVTQNRQHRAFLDSLTNSGCRDYLKSELQGPKEKIIRAAIWNQLITQLLEAPTGAFLDMSEAQYKKRFSGDLEGFCLWRSLTASVADSNDTEPNSWAQGGIGRQEFVSETVALLKPYTNIPKYEATLTKRLDAIAGLAFKLAKHMALSKAYWVCTMGDSDTGKLHSFEIQPDCMNDKNVVVVEGESEDDEDSNEQQEGTNEHDKDSNDDDQDWTQEEEDLMMVDLVFSPMLLKFGNSCGENYSSRDVVKKARVITEPPIGIE